MAVIELLTVKGKKIIEHGDTCWEVEDDDMDSNNSEMDMETPGVFEE